jgi:glycosyltransferase involved in cell wall biosynthesis
MTSFSPLDVSAVVCTLNSISGIERCLISLREAGVGELIVVDAHSADGTREVAQRLADRLLDDPGTGLGNARNVGIAQTTKPLILNMGSDNALPPGQLQQMIEFLEVGEFAGVSSRTVIDGEGYASRGLNAWRRGRFRSGPASVIGTPTLFRGDLLRANPYDSTRRFSDDSELCERWADAFGAKFGIADAYVLEVGKTTWEEVAVRCRMYGISDHEVYRNGIASGWSISRRAKSLAHPLRVDFISPLGSQSLSQAIPAIPFLAVFTLLRYRGWVEAAIKSR